MGYRCHIGDDKVSLRHQCTGCICQSILHLDACKHAAVHRVELHHMVLDPRFVQNALGLHQRPARRYGPPHTFETLFSGEKRPKETKVHRLYGVSQQQTRTRMQYGQYAVLNTVTLCVVVARRTNSRAAASASRERAAPIGRPGLAEFNVRHTKHTETIANALPRVRGSNYGAPNPSTRWLRHWWLTDRLLVIFPSSLPLRSGRASGRGPTWTATRRSSCASG